MTDLMTILALMFGFALLCVMAAIYWLSRRQIHVTQNNSTSVTTSDRTDSSTGGSGRVERFLIKWTFILLIGGIAIATLANAISTVTTSFPNASVGNPSAITVATPAPMPTVAAPLLPLPLGEGRGEGTSASTNPLTIIVPLLSGAALTIWVYATVNIIKIKRARRRTSPAKREAELESILPDAVNQL